jgi:hypothetical protein
MSLRHYGSGTAVPLGTHLMTLTTTAGWKEGDITVSEPRTLGTLAAELATMLDLPGTVVDLVITTK